MAKYETHRFFKGEIKLNFEDHEVWAKSTDEAFEKLVKQAIEHLEVMKIVSYEDEDEKKNTMIKEYDYYGNYD
jgi:hypothetical protein|tara:strand:+ start:195 stop:413 length:219 start_codon:yes stop_codon:yes gene_type:complete